MTNKRTSLTVVVFEPDGERSLTVPGQFARTLDALIEAGERGVTALEVSSWALRLAHYIFILKRKHLLNIEMQREPHATGEHGRYFLRSRVRIVGRNDDQAQDRAVA